MSEEYEDQNVNENEDGSVDGFDSNLDNAGSPREKEEQIARMMTGQPQTSMDQQQAFQRIMADPDVLRVLAAKQSGKKIKVSEEEEFTPEPVETGMNLEDVDFESMTQSEIVKFIADGMKSVIGNIMEKEVAPLKATLNQVEGFMKNQASMTVQQEIAQARKKYPDFGRYEQKMAELWENHQTLGVDDLYILAKARSGGNLSEQTSNMSSERPSTSSARPPQRSGVPRGKKGFESLLSGALEKNPYRPNG